LTFPSADLLMRVATLVMIFPTDAKKTSRLIGLWNALEDRNVTTINTHPTTERLELTRSIMTIALS
jgi:hypothetical protein